MLLLVQLNSFLKFLCIELVSFRNAYRRYAVCEDGSEPVGRRCQDRSKPSCSDGERPDTCSDGSEPAKHPKPCEEGRPSCEDDSRPSCEDGSRPRKGKCGDGSEPLCEDEEEPVCPDGSPIVRPPTCPN